MMDEWKKFYRKDYAGDWEQFSQSLGGQEYHRNYQQACLSKIRESNPRKVLEVGVGRGDLLSQLSGQSIELYGCDLSEGNLAAASASFQALDFPVSLCHADAENLPFRSASFDTVYSLSVLWYLPDPAATVAEMCRVARPGGTIVFDMLNAFHVTSVGYHVSRIVNRLLGRERGRTSLAHPREVAKWVAPYSRHYEIYGSYILMPVGFPLLGECANWYRVTPRRAARMTASPLRYLAHKLVVVATRGEG
ncbi:MAG TPA: class I SAM-dependent methyltransferase [bacterium]|nr:class I SAM-dependent methyltransferase [bacterium]HQP97521.1 class I SAM-dependent methyltransferase [bacterium]